MATVSLTLVTIIAEPVLEERLTQELRRLGATGHTITDGRGRGTRGLHAAEKPGTVIRIESIVRQEVADAVLALMAERYFPDFGVVAYVSAVEVVRGEKYV